MKSSTTYLLLGGGAAAVLLYLVTRSGGGNGENAPGDNRIFFYAPNAAGVSTRYLQLSAPGPDGYVRAIDQGTQKEERVLAVNVTKFE